MQSETQHIKINRNTLKNNKNTAKHSETQWHANDANPTQRKMMQIQHSSVKQIVLRCVLLNFVAKPSAVYQQSIKHNVTKQSRV